MKRFSKAFWVAVGLLGAIIVYVGLLIKFALTPGPTTNPPAMEESRIRPPSELVADLPPFPAESGRRRYILFDYVARGPAHIDDAPASALYLAIPQTIAGRDGPAPTAAWGVSIRASTAVLVAATTGDDGGCEPDCPGELMLLIENRSGSPKRGAAIAAAGFERVVAMVVPHHDTLVVERQTATTKVMLQHVAGYPTSPVAERHYLFYSGDGAISEYIACKPFAPNPICSGSTGDSDDHGLLVTYTFAFKDFPQHERLRDLVRRFVDSTLRATYPDPEYNRTKQQAR